MICAWRKLKYNTSVRVLHRMGKLAVRKRNQVYFMIFPVRGGMASVLPWLCFLFSSTPWHTVKSAMALEASQSLIQDEQMKYVKEDYCD